MRRRDAITMAGITMLAYAVRARAQTPGTVTGSIDTVSSTNTERTWSAAHVVLPAVLTGEVWHGTPANIQAVPGDRPRVAIAVLMHGSGGITPAITEYQDWLAGLGIASVAPDSFAIPDRIAYTSPVGKDVYEKVHALRLAELTLAVVRVSALGGVDPDRVVLIGTSEGSVAVGRYAGNAGRARIIYSWACEANYFVDQLRLGIPPDQPVLNVIAARDPYFSPANKWNDGYNVTGDCRRTLAGNPYLEVVKVDTDVHTVMNRPEARDAAAAFLKRVLA